MYTDLPRSFTKQDYIGDNSSRPYLSFNLSEKEKPAPEEVEYWLSRLDENGDEYFFNEVTF